MKRIARQLAAILLVVCSTSLMADEVEIWSPGFPRSKVADDGSLVEPWGALGLRIIDPKGAKVTEHRAAALPMPAAITCTAAGSAVMTQTVYRAPVWPSGADVLEAKVTNAAATPVRVELELAVPAALAFGESAGQLNGKPTVALPGDLQPVRDERPWGCLGGVQAMPGWAKPKVPCDPAFRNISAGMGGVPIKYRFAVPPGAKRTVMLGFCESYHPSAGIRPVAAFVEGAPSRSIDPIETWGRHVPGVVRFTAHDVNGDGRLEVAVATHPRASDRNTILNVIWVFEPDAPIEQDALIAGQLNDQAERYVDVGGKGDQELYKPGNLRYVFELQPKGQRTLLFLMASPGCQVLPDLSRSEWDKDRLRSAAADVWRDRW